MQRVEQGDVQARARAVEQPLLLEGSSHGLPRRQPDVTMRHHEDLPPARSIVDPAERAGPQGRVQPTRQGMAEAPGPQARPAEARDPQIRPTDHEEDVVHRKFLRVGWRRGGLVPLFYRVQAWLAVWYASWGNARFHSAVASHTPAASSARWRARAAARLRRSWRSCAGSLRPSSW